MEPIYTAIGSTLLSRLGAQDFSTDDSDMHPNDFPPGPEPRWHAILCQLEQESFDSENACPNYDAVEGRLAAVRADLRDGPMFLIEIWRACAALGAHRHQGACRICERAHAAK